MNGLIKLILSVFWLVLTVLYFVGVYKPDFWVIALLLALQSVDNFGEFLTEMNK